MFYILSQVLGYVLSGWPDTCDNDVLKPFYSRRMELSTQAGCLLWGNRVIVPPPGRQLILDELHAGHPGVSRMKSLARMFVWWPRLDSDVEDRVKSRLSGKSSLTCNCSFSTMEFVGKKATVSSRSIKARSIYSD